ncbi:hypothetical protein FA95DRAFT_815892 [Auriscalpium vulgare]|uniref:Uncharacterized protein n=1 Tax=Auriscalpium vulgare TaxID=40419 RepID=A0ACB8RZZ9_9AGAM|nr:hypothetical protein FA95DRAFT_815892 [Auriscalpium vulgare]
MPCEPAHTISPAYRTRLFAAYNHPTHQDVRGAFDRHLLYRPFPSCLSLIRVFAVYLRHSRLGLGISAFRRARSIGHLFLISMALGPCPSLTPSLLFQHCQHSSQSHVDSPFCTFVWPPYFVRLLTRHIISPLFHFCSNLSTATASPDCIHVCLTLTVASSDAHGTCRESRASM